MADNAYTCGDSGTTLNINYNGLTLSPGDVVFWDDGDAGRGCATIVDVDDPISTNNAQTLYTDCYDCYNNNNGIVSLGNCAGGDKIIVPISDLGYVIDFNSVIYATIDVAFKGVIQRITGCWEIQSYSTPTTEDYNRIDLSSIVTLGDVYNNSRSNCSDCYDNNLVTYEVTRCVEGNTDYILLLGGSVQTGNTISYTDGTDIYCGVLVGEAIAETSWYFVYDYGNPGEGGDFCNDCLTASNQKVLLESCTDPSNLLVVWSSLLFGIGEYSHLSTDDGCFRIIGPTEDDVTNNYFLNFQPSPGCDPCIECNGVAYEYSTCNEEPTTGTVYLYQYLPSGTTYYDPYQQTCATLGNITTGGDYTLYSVTTFDGCTDCSENANFELWYGTICETGQNIYVTTVSSEGLTAGNVVKAMWGSNEYVCVQLDSIVSGTDSATWYDTKKDSLGNTQLYDGCTTCISSSNIVVGLINCDTDEDSYVTISLSNYLSIIGNGFTLPNYTIRDQRQNCYTITSVCPLPSSASTESMLAVYFYFSCQYCPDQIITSANTEYNTCVICCECGSTGSTVNSVSTPHPIYTDGYNNPIMQLNMVVLGGTNGLNA